MKHGPVSRGSVSRGPVSRGLSAGAPSALPLRLPLRLGLLLGLALVGAVVLAFSIARAPELTAGAVLGLAILAVTIRWPRVVVTLLLVVGPVDLSFITGGLKGLAPQLGGLDMNGIRLVAATAGISAVVALDPKLRAELLKPPALIYGVFLAWCAVRLPGSPAPLEGLRFLLKMLWPLLVLLVVAHPDRTRGEVEGVTRWILGGALVLLLANPIWVALGGYHYDWDGKLRVHGLGLEQNPFSFYLLIMVVIGVAYLLHRGRAGPSEEATPGVEPPVLSRADTMIALAVVLLAFGWLGLTLTRITLLAAFMALVLLGAVALWRERNVKVGALVVAALGVLGVVFVPLVLIRTFGELPTPSALMELFRDPLRLYQTINFQGRELVWAILYVAWEQSPWIGIGLGGSTHVLLTNLGLDGVTVAHNEYLRLGTDLGWVGVGLAALTTGALAAAARGGRENPWTLPVFAALMVWAVVSITDNPLDYYTPFTQYVGFLVGAALVWNRPRSPE
jgi:hypothetical protein